MSEIANLLEKSVSKNLSTNPLFSILALSL
jgi:hypothetical protein